MKSVVIQFPFDRILNKSTKVNADVFDVDDQLELFKKPVIVEKSNGKIGCFIVDNLLDAISTIELNKTHYFFDQRLVKSFFEKSWNRSKWLDFLDKNNVVYSSYDDFFKIVQMECKKNSQCIICLLVDDAERYVIDTDPLTLKKMM